MKFCIRLFLRSLVFTSILFSINGSKNGVCQCTKDYLKSSLKQKLNNSLCAFDLAEIYRKKKKYAKALNLYIKCKDLNGEEGWYSEYMMGKCYEFLKDWKNAKKYYNSAFKRCPTRAEPLFDMASYYFTQKKFSKVCSLAILGKDLMYPKKNRLFIDPNIDRSKFYELLSVAAYYDENHKHKGTDYIDEIMFNQRISNHAKMNCWSNLFYYLENIEDVEFIPIDATMPFLTDWSLERYKTCNPSIIKTETGYLVNCRGVNYVQWAPQFVIIDGTQKTKSKNVLIKYDKNLNKIFETVIKEDVSLKRYKTKTQGLEDLRLFKLNNELYFTATTCQLTKSGIPKMCLGKFDFSDKEMSSVEINKIILLQGPIAERAEKNWMPLVREGELYLIYSFDPYLMYKPNIFTGECKEFINKDPGFDFSRFAGSAPPIPFDDGYLVMIHEGIWLDRKYYFHRFVYLDKDFQIKKLSRPFTFKHKGVEMCCGMVIDHDEKKLIMTIALEDREAYFALMQLDSVRLMLKDLCLKK